MNCDSMSVLLTLEMYNNTFIGKGVASFKNNKQENARSAVL